MDAVTAGDLWWRCRHHLRLQLPLPLSLIPFCSLGLQWIWNDRAGFWNRDTGRQVFQTAERSGSVAMPDARLDAMRCVESACEVPPDAGVLWLLVPGTAVGVFIDGRCLPDGVEVTRWVIPATPELVSENEGVQCWPWIVEATELPAWEVSLSPAGAGTRLLAGGSWEVPKRLHCWCVWTIHMTGVVSGWEIWDGILWYRSSILRI